MALTFVTNRDYVMVMAAVGVARFKARLSEYLRRVRAGAEVTILDRETPIARVVPFTGETTPLSVRRPRRGAPRPGRVLLPRPLPLPIDVVALLLEERQGQR